MTRRAPAQSLPSGWMTGAASGKSIGRGVAWSTLAFVCGRLLTFVSLLVVARVVSPGEFGVVAAVLAYLGILELVSDLGMRSTVVYEQERGVTKRVDVAFTMNLGFAVVLSAAGVLIAPLIAGFFGVSDDTWLFRLAALNVVLSGLGNVHDGLLIRGLEFKRRTIPLLSRGAVRGVVTIILALAGFGAPSLVVGLLAGSLAWTTLLWALADEHPHLRFDRAIARSMVGYGAGAAALQLTALLAGKIDVTVIGRVLGTQALGIYTIAYRLPELVIESVAWNVSWVAFPALSARRAETGGNSEVARSALGLARWQTLYALPAAAGLAVLSTPIVVVLFGPQWASAGGVLIAISVAEAMTVALFPLGDGFRAVGRQRGFVTLQLCVMPLLGVLIVLAAPYGLTAVAWMQVVEVSLMAAGTLVLARRILGVRARDLGAAVAPSVVAAIGVVLAAGGLRLAWPATTAPALLAGIVCGVAGAALALRLAQPAVWRELRSVASRLGGRLRARVGAPAPV